MVRAPRRRSLGLTITLSVIAVAMAIALLVAWILVIVGRVFTGPQMHLAPNVWLLVAGIVSLVTIMTVLVLFTVFLIKQIREVRRQDTFIDSVTHELKSPLASIRLALETLGRAELASEPRERLHAMMMADVDRLTALIDGVLAASRVGLVTSAQDLTSIDLAALVRERAGDLTRRANLSPDAVVVEVAAPTSLRTDAGALRTVVDNLLDNAIKYSDPPVKVTARVGGDARWVVLEVEDRGIGIGRGDLRRGFGRFYRVPEEGVRARHGTGLGLYLVYSLARSLGGRVDVESKGTGQGSTFRVRLPRPRE
jgi:signal transduction histidine kinase